MEKLTSHGSVLEHPSSLALPGYLSFIIPAHGTCRTLQQPIPDTIVMEVMSTSLHNGQDDVMFVPSVFFKAYAAASHLFFTLNPHLVKQGSFQGYPAE